MFYDGIFTNILDNSGKLVPNVQGGTITAPAPRLPTPRPADLANATGLLRRCHTCGKPNGNLEYYVSHILNPVDIPV